MRARSSMELLQLPVQVQGIRLGRPVDLLLDAKAWRVLGFVVLCGDESLRFLAHPAAELRADEIAVPSALLLLEDVEFYRRRSRSLRSLLGAPVASRGRAVGLLHDLVVGDDGDVASLLVAQDGAVAEVEPAGAQIELAPAA
jgi:uncharacterized protein YrrD